MEKDKPIRSISRCISILQALNKGDSRSMAQLAQDAKVPYATACRIVQTLLAEGLIEREPSRPRYRPTALVHSLSRGFQNEDALVAVARRHIVALTDRFLWPIAVTTRVGQQMIVRDSTHALTPMTLNNYNPGYTFPIIGSAAGRAYLAFCDPAEQRQLLTSLRTSSQYYGDDAIGLMESGVLFSDIRKQGYATKLRNQYTETPGKTSSLAAPVFDDGQLRGVLILSYFTSAMRMSAAEAMLAEPLMEAARQIGQSLVGDALTGRSICDGVEVTPEPRPRSVPRRISA